MTYLYLDIETIPAQTERAKAAVAASVKPPAAMKKADTIAAWEKDQKAQAVEDAIAKTSFDGGLGHICCIGFALDDGKIMSQTAMRIEDEKQILEDFFEYVSVSQFNKYAPITIVGHYVAGFDIRFITQRAIVLGVKLPAWWPLDPKPWSQEVFDTMTAWAGAKGSISLDNLCFALGLEGKGDMDGSMVAKMFADGMHVEITTYCKEDVARVRSVHRKMHVSIGEAA